MIVELNEAEARAVATVRAAVASELRTLVAQLGLPSTGEESIPELRGLIIHGVAMVEPEVAPGPRVAHPMAVAAAKATGARSPLDTSMAGARARHAVWYVLKSMGLSSAAAARSPIGGRTWDTSTVWSAVKRASAMVESGDELTLRAVAAARAGYRRAMSMGLHCDAAEACT